MYIEEEIVAAAGSKRAALVKHFEEKKKVVEDRIKKFQDEMGKGPARALEWADQIFEAVAIKEVCDAVLYMLKHYTEISDVTQSLQSSVRCAGRYINNKSTSVCGNFMKENLLAQLIQAMEHVELVDNF